MQYHLKSITLHTRTIKKIFKQIHCTQTHPTLLQSTILKKQVYRSSTADTKRVSLYTPPSQSDRASASLKTLIITKNSSLTTVSKISFTTHISCVKVQLNNTTNISLIHA